MLPGTTRLLLARSAAEVWSCFYLSARPPRPPSAGVPTRCSHRKRRTRTRTRARAQAHTYKGTCAQQHAHTQANVHTNTHTQAHTYTPTYKCNQIRPQEHTHTHSKQSNRAEVYISEHTGLSLLYLCLLSSDITVATGMSSGEETPHRTSDL